MHSDDETSVYALLQRSQNRCKAKTKIGAVMKKQQLSSADVLKALIPVVQNLKTTVW
jgi:hypothetical protein